MTTLLVRHRITDLDTRRSLHDSLAAPHLAHRRTGARSFVRPTIPDAVATALLPIPAPERAFARPAPERLAHFFHSFHRFEKILDTVI
ncbi:hypothetical protein [Nannocystis pusilla]|uniref:hypothetical protein n=1 Tax=Nannocystis pusilla TaxID=889268 RepID=UPI003DA5BC8B